MSDSDRRILRVLTVNIQAASSTRRYSDYVTRSWSHALPIGRKRITLDAIAQLVAERDIVGLQESDPGSLRSGFTNQTHYLAQRAGFCYWNHQPNRRMAGVASSANGLLSRLKPREVQDHALPGRMGGRGVLLAKFGDDLDSLVVAVAHLSLGVHSRMAQLAFIADLLAEHPNTILMGDFNCMADRPEMQVLYRRTRLQPPDAVIPTFPSWRPQRAIDHILVSQGLHICKTEAIPAAFSDHLAVSMEIVIPQCILC
ncbi:endonuclease/exonuclease/phosphatase family protein [Xylella taiwanensis]|uniref:Endonuclease n=1 Tax=Xylella taiwanensis TaxID=1444770 RepID=Z9JHH1_9GAMM|nr:endonuclease/exonuclease/phosphatase family protein [Xylella taiwanensis]AXI83932.1 endonuclease [Xylella taiwanensis]EWS77448.1 endonuclease [Xylella taiwanensis]MCD8457039.1 endonuclease/exonuclease/phosphatase family protein [Xylella taiwanensis]MCD8459449.1 endonuclease/exonuclease/phosphatase family protein [Xylella taiwanensis]MCD8461682.1 endonuclease/exonuclease/phosphatase family protein [Xylella taiwanensis]